MDTLRSYLKSLPEDDRIAYAARCGTSLGYLNKALSLDKNQNKRPVFDAALVARLHAESGGVVRKEDLRVDADVIWPAECRVKRGHARAH